MLKSQYILYTEIHSPNLGVRVIHEFILYTNNFSKIHFNNLNNFSKIHFNNLNNFSKIHFNNLNNFSKIHFNNLNNFSKIHFNNLNNFSKNPEGKRKLFLEGRGVCFVSFFCFVFFGFFFFLVFFFCLFVVFLSFFDIHKNGKSIDFSTVWFISAQQGISKKTLVCLNWNHLSYMGGGKWYHLCNSLEWTDPVWYKWYVPFHLWSLTKKTFLFPFWFIQLNKFILC